MAISVRWLEPQILYYTLRQPYSWDELNASIDEALAMARTLGSQECGTLLDVTGATSIPPGAIEHGLDIIKRKPANANFVVVFGANALVKGFHQVVQTMFPAITRYVAFADDAESGLMKLRRMMGDRLAPVIPAAITAQFSSPIAAELFFLISRDPGYWYPWNDYVFFGMSETDQLQSAKDFIRDIVRDKTGRYTLTDAEWREVIAALKAYDYDAAEPNEASRANGDQSGDHP